MKIFSNILIYLMAIVMTVSSSDSLKTKIGDTAHFGLNVTSDSIVLANVGYSAYVDVNMVWPNGSVVNATKTATWSTPDPSMVEIGGGRILALKKGNAIVTVSYQGYKKTIGVTTTNDENLENKYVINNGNVLSTATVSSSTVSQRNAILKRCSDMLNFHWTPTKDLCSYDAFVFKAGMDQKGIPYSYTNNLSDSKIFASAMSYTNFYKNMFINGKSQPSYGSDCSGFVTLAWQLAERYDTVMFLDGIKYGTFAKVGAYSAYTPNPEDLKKAYAQLLPGDAVVMREDGHGHVYIIAANQVAGMPGQLFAYEQTPPYCQFTRHTYEDMARKKFMPFKLKKL